MLLQTETHETNPEKANIFNNNQKQIKRANFLLKSLNSPVRQRIISLLLFTDKLAVHELCKEMQLGQSAVSQHLAVLHKAKLVKTHREGKESFYFINEEHLNEIIEFVKQLSNK